MSKLKISENLFLGVQEFEHFQKFLSDEGFKRHFLLNTESFGLIRQSMLPEIGDIPISENFYVEKSGTPYDEVIINKGFAINSNADLIYNDELLNLSIPNDSRWYWIKIKYREKTEERGIINIDNLGQCTGIGTEFISKLRGQAQFPSKIRFTNSVNGNVNEYEVVKVISDTSIVLQGDFISEQNLKYEIIGTFTPGFVPTEDNKKIFRYDNVDISLVLEQSLGNPPAYIVNDEFYIARVRNNGINLNLEDKRTQWWQSESSNLINYLDRNFRNPLIGVENIKYDLETSTKDENLIELSWGMRSISWTVDTSSKRISILIGNGGVYKDTSYFNNSDFTGWRLYNNTGKWRTIVDSIKTGTQIILTLDVLNPEDYIENTQLLIVPPYEEIEIRVRGNNQEIPLSNAERIHKFSINIPLGKFKIPAQDSCYKYNLTYRYKIFNDYSEWMQFPDDFIGYYSETSFDLNGNLKEEIQDRIRKPYTGDLNNGFIEVCEHYFSYDNFVDMVFTGDLFGVNTTKFTNAEPVIELIVGTSKKYQHFVDNSPFVLNSDIYIHLNRYTDSSKTILCKEGNTFYLHIEQFLDLSTFKLRIVENYENPTDYNLITELDENDICYIKNNCKTIDGIKRGLFITCTFNDKGNWIISYDTDIRPKGSIEIKKNVPISAFTASGIGNYPGYYGWRIMSELNDTFISGALNISDIGTEGGSNEVIIPIKAIPDHKHYTVAGSYVNDNNGQIVNADNTVSVRGDRQGDGHRYQLHGVSEEAKWGKTSGVIGGSNSNDQEKFNNRPKFIKFLFIEKIV